jgi:DNA-binding MarR family transcriptional regulator
MAAQRLSRRQKRILQWLAVDHQRTQGMITSSHQELVRALPGDKGNISHSLHTLEARGLIVLGRSPGGKAEALWLTPEGQKWASQLIGSCDEGESSVAAMSCSACNSLYIVPFLLETLLKWLQRCGKGCGM